ncbi:MAG: amidohydrolase family protein [Paracoccus sp. (in: a-proteobacteria)]|nr:amidohydrolase family protein [Paracoccus sp. (in: a-proteobacteria)]
MSVIDAHVHFWRPARGDYGWLDGAGLERLRRDFDPADYPGKGAVIAVQAAPTVDETRYLLSLDDPRILGVVGWADLAAPDAAAQITALATDRRLRGLRPMLQDIADTEWLMTTARPEAFAAMQDAGLVLDALVTARHLPMLARFAERHPDLRIVIDHAAKPQPGARAGWRADMARLAADPRIHCKLSGLMTELKDPAEQHQVAGDLLDLFGPGRLIWGSDWPVLTLAASFDDWHRLSGDLLAGLPAQARAAIMGGNAARVYGTAT